MKSEVISDHRDYPSRWGVLGTVFFLNIANNALWISYSSVASTSAEYYEKSVSDVDWLGSIGFIVGKIKNPLNPDLFQTSKLMYFRNPHVPYINMGGGQVWSQNCHIFGHHSNICGRFSESSGKY